MTKKLLGLDRNSTDTERKRCEGERESVTKEDR